jgi:hypothetical protein
MVKMAERGQTGQDGAPEFRAQRRCGERGNGDRLRAGILVPSASKRTTSDGGVC